VLIVRLIKKAERAPGGEGTKQWMEHRCQKQTEGADTGFIHKPGYRSHRFEGNDGSPEKNHVRME
jgi:hypothetical protein